MEITSAELARYRKEIDALSDAAKSYVEMMLKAFRAENPKASVAEFREAAVNAVKNALNAFGDQASVLACDFFDEIMEAEGYPARADIVDRIDRSMIDGKVRYFARELVLGNIASFDNSVSDLSRYYVKRSAYENIVANCDRNDIRFARVPSGTETCSFCFMLSSRGFVYLSEATATGNHGMHDHCDCIVIPGVQGKTSIEGYDPDAMYERWRQCERTCGSNDPKSVMREVETRDWRWLYSGKQCAVTKERGARPNSDERAVAGILSGLGFRTEFVAESKEKFVKSPDAKLNGRLWEFKIPTAFNEKTVKNQFKKSLGKGTSKLLISNYANGADAADMVAYIRRILDSGEFAEIDEVLFVGADGTLVRLKR